MALHSHFGFVAQLRGFYSEMYGTKGSERSE